jgi:hypothetical protein
MSLRVDGCRLIIPVRRACNRSKHRDEFCRG